MLKLWAVRYRYPLGSATSVFIVKNWLVFKSMLLAVRPPTTLDCGSRKRSKVSR